MNSMTLESGLLKPVIKILLHSRICFRYSSDWPYFYTFSIPYSKHNYTQRCFANLMVNSTLLEILEIKGEAFSDDLFFLFDIARAN